MHSMNTLMFYILPVTDKLTLEIDFNLLNLNEANLLWLKQLVHYWQLYKTKSTGAIRFYIPMYKITLDLHFSSMWIHLVNTKISKFQMLQCSAIMIITFPLNGWTTNTFIKRHKTQWLQASSSYSKVKKYWTWLYLKS